MANFNIKSDFIQPVEELIAGGDATEHSYRPLLKQLLQALAPATSATNEPKRIDCGAPDFVIRADGLVVGYVEAKDPAVALESVEDSEQMVRYRKNLENLVLTNTHEFRWYVKGELVSKAKLATFDKKTRSLKSTNSHDAEKLLSRFLARTPSLIKSAETLAIRLAGLADAIRGAIIAAYDDDVASPLLESWREAITKILVADLSEPSQTPRFADMIAQTLAYGLFTARMLDPTSETFSRQEAQTLIPKSNPFLRKFFFQLSAPDMDEEPYSGFVDDIVTVLAKTDVNAILKNFGKTTKAQDPIVHFYETFLAAYDPRLRELRGVYYTPQPVISYLVRSVDHILTTKFRCEGGLADATMVTVKATSGNKNKAGNKVHKVTIVDPACGTGAFLYEVISQIRSRFKKDNNAGLWNDYVREHLLPRLFGFEILMAPYAIAHFKLGLELMALDLPEGEREIWQYPDAANSRLGVYLTNTLEPPHHFAGLPLFTQWLSDETNAANEIKNDTPIMVVIGNPPYSNFGQQNKNEHITKLLTDYKKGLKEKKLNLDDDYIKFIKFAQDRIDKSGQGVVAFVTNSSFTTGLIHRRMRESLRETFSEIYVLNLHGDAITREAPPGGGRDANVFDIKQGVAATIFVKVPGAKTPGTVWYQDLWGTRKEKYAALDELDVTSVKWEQLTKIADESCLGKFFFFRATSGVGIKDYCEGIGLDAIFNIKGSGIQTKRDALLVSKSDEALKKAMEELLKHGPTAVMHEKYPIATRGGWSTDRLKGASYDAGAVRPYAYRPYDWRFVYYHETILGRSRKKVSPHFLKKNLGLSFLRQTVDDGFRHVLVTSGLTDLNYLMSHHVSDRVAPLYEYTKMGAKIVASPNILPAAVKTFSDALQLEFVASRLVSQKTKWEPEDLFYYIYAVLWSPSYRARYGEFLKISYPRVPTKIGAKEFFALGKLGRKLADLHLLTKTPKKQPSYPAAGDNKVGRLRYIEATQRLYINKTQYLAGVPARVWSHKIGCYTVVSRWLTERRGDTLKSADLDHLRKMIGAIDESYDVLDRIDKALTSAASIL